MEYVFLVISICTAYVWCRTPRKINMIVPTVRRGTRCVKFSSKLHLAPRLFTVTYDSPCFALSCTALSPCLLPHLGCLSPVIGRYFFTWEIPLSSWLIAGTVFTHFAYRCYYSSMVVLTSLCWSRGIEQVFFCYLLCLRTQFGMSLPTALSGYISNDHGMKIVFVEVWNTCNLLLYKCKLVITNNYSRDGLIFPEQLKQFTKLSYIVSIVSKLGNLEPLMES